MNKDAQSNNFLEVQDLCVSYGSIWAVDHLSLSVRAGEIYGFLGRNGAGKTSTIRALMGLLSPASGRIKLLDYRGKRINSRQRIRIGYVSQEQHFYPWMTCHALGKFVGGFYPTWDRDEFARLLDVLDVPPRRRVSHLSGGMRVKLALALALAHSPPILILDEPTAGLDPVTRREFLEIIQQQSRAHHRTTFFSSHLIDEVERVADRVGIIHKGQLRYEGDIQTLQESVREICRAPNLADDIITDLRQPLMGETESGQPPESNVQPQPAETVHQSALNSVQATDHPSQELPKPDTTASNESSHWMPQEMVEGNGFQLLRNGFGGSGSLIVYGRPEAWSGTIFKNCDVRRLSLEDIFIAMTTEVTPLL